VLRGKICPAVQECEQDKRGRSEEKKERKTTNEEFTDDDGKRVVCPEKMKS
jgi:hypothetical protein